MIMKNVQSNAGTVTVMALMIMAVCFLAIGGLRYGDESGTEFDRLCHTEGEIPQECVREFPAVPVCVHEDCSDAWPHAGFWRDDFDGRWFYQVPDTPIIEASQS